MLDEISSNEFWDAAEVTYNYLSPPSVTQAIARARAKGIAIISMKSLLNTNTPFDRLSHPPRQESGASAQVRDTLGDIRTEKIPGTTPQQALIKWVLNNPSVDTTIPGMTAFEHLQDDLRVMNLEFTFDTEKLLQKQSEFIRGQYCRGVLGCTGCEGQCPSGVRVGEINRCLGYAYGYGDLELARENYQRLPESGKIDRCADCVECRVKCVYGLKLNENIHRARLLFC